jgi:hypothetical protein
MLNRFFELNRATPCPDLISNLLIQAPLPSCLGPAPNTYQGVAAGESAATAKTSSSRHRKPSTSPQLSTQKVGINS